MNGKVKIGVYAAVAALVVRTLAAALPLADSFENQPNGAPPAGAQGWGLAGAGQAWVTNSELQTTRLVDWAFTTGVGYPLSSATHTQVLVLNGAVSNVFGVTGEQTLWFDFMLDPQPWTGAVPPAISASALGAFYVTAQGDLALARSSDPGLVTSNLWTVLSGTGVATDNWSRLTVQWVGGVDGAFFAVRINGSNPVTHASGWSMPDETAPRNGPWFPCPNAAARLTPASFNLSGQGQVDDWRLSSDQPTYDPAPIPTAVITVDCDSQAGTVAPGPVVEVPAGRSPAFVVEARPYYYISDLMTNGVSIGQDFASVRTTRFEFVWNAIPAGLHTLEPVLAPERADKGVSIPWLLEYYPDATDFDDAAQTDLDGDSMPAWMEYLAGTDPNDPDSYLQIVGQGIEGGSNYLKWVSREVVGLPPFIIWRMTNIAQTVWEPVGLYPRSSEQPTNIWFDPNSVPGSYYRLEVQAP